MNVHPALKGEHRVFDFRGSPFEIGVQHGQALRAKILEEFAGICPRMAAEMGMSESAMIDQVYAKHSPLFRDRVPIGMEEVEGIAKGTGLTVAQAFFAATRDGLKRVASPPACTSFACGIGATRDGKVLMGQSKDTGLSTERYHIMRYAYSSGRRMVVLNYPGWIGNIGLTSDGMALAGNSLYAEAPKNPTVPYSLLKRLVLEKKNVGEVLKGIEGLSFENGCFMVGDRTGRIVCIESVAGTWSAREVTGQAFGHANSILTDVYKPLESEKLGSPSSPTRQKNIQQRLDEHRGSITVDTLKEILKDHADYPKSLCLHSHDGEPHHTTAAFVANLTDLTIDIAIGNPCTQPFQRYTLPS